MLTGAASIYTIERALPMWLASRVARHPDHLAMRCAYGMKRGEVLPRALLDLRAGRLAQHSRHPVDPVSCFAECADKLVARGVVKGGFKDDVESTVANCWQAPEPSTCRSFAVTCSAGASGHPAELTST